MNSLKSLRDTEHYSSRDMRDLTPEVAGAQTGKRPLRKLNITCTTFSSHAVDDSLNSGYNRYVQFAEGLPDDSEALLKAEEIERNVRAINSIIAKASREACKEVALVRDNVKNFMSATMESSEQWYATGDLTRESTFDVLTRYWAERATELTYWDLGAKLDSQAITDAKQFFEYLCKVMPKAALANPLPDEMEHDRRNPRKNFADKCMRLVEMMRDLPNGRFYTFHSYTLLSSEVLRPSHPRCEASKLPTTDILEKLKDLVLRPIRTVFDNGDGDEYDEEAYPEYWDFATPARDMFRYMGERCLGSRVNTYCHHVCHLPTLQFLQQQAYCEIRTKVLLIAGAKLPVELTDQIFELAMLAEEMPLIPEPAIVLEEERAKRVMAGRLPEDEEPWYQKSLLVCEKLSFADRE
ncbi:hypothetical protein LTR36_010800 [Oleoguttula mirabilis]|uniref:Uncharacterized protein n=1 Tax=Oleoguttula mirabilis TaxID=1507867 RepID=A0AAV9JRN3_9PEZI|nr:hypothetical protein LTR36_010800 [Oleoguttula mirabilis]